MPLKHRTETRLIVLLALMVVLAGIVTASLPDLPGGFVPWALTFAVSCGYPLVLYPMLKSNRADYEFRLLHWVPATIVLLWLAVQVLAFSVLNMPALAGWYTKFWTVGPVRLGIIGLIAFSLSVIRRWLRRVLALGVVAALFVAGAVATELGWKFDQQLTAALWDHDLFQVGEDLLGQIALVDGGDADSEASNEQPIDDLSLIHI